MTRTKTGWSDFPFHALEADTSVLLLRKERDPSLTIDRLVGLVVKASASRAEDPGFESHLRRGFFRGRVIPVTSKLALQWLPCQAPGVIGSALGLVGPMSVYCDWVR